jgi:type IV secretion system protein VirB6
MIQTVPDTLATSLLGQHEKTSSAELIDTAANEGFSEAGDAFNKAGIFSKQGLVYGIFGILLLLSTIAITTIGGIFIILAKVVLCVLAALGPLFIFALLFDSTAKLFESWVSQLLSYGLLIILMSSVFGFLLHLYSGYISKIHFDGVINIAATIGGCVILSFATVIILLQLPAIASALSQGVALDSRGIPEAFGRKIFKRNKQDN